MPESIRGTAAQSSAVITDADVAKLAFTVLDEPPAGSRSALAERTPDDAYEACVPEQPAS